MMSSAQDTKISMHMHVKKDISQLREWKGAAKLPGMFKPPAEVVDSYVFSQSVLLGASL